MPSHVKFNLVVTLWAQLRISMCIIETSNTIFSSRIFALFKPLFLAQTQCTWLAAHVQVIRYSQMQQLFQPTQCAFELSATEWTPWGSKRKLEQTLSFDIFTRAKVENISGYDCGVFELNDSSS